MTIMITDGVLRMEITPAENATNYEIKVAIDALAESFFRKRMFLEEGKFCPRCWAVVDVKNLKAYQTHLEDECDVR